MVNLSEKKLNKQQFEAVHHKEGPLLIIAGAGTGKTTVITERIKWLIGEGYAKPSEILALTFTEKAAKEMEERVDRVLPYGYTQMYITTFHAFGDRILRQEALEIGLNPGYTLATGAQSIIFFRKNLFKFDLNYFRPLGNPTKFVEAMLIHFSRLKDEDISPSEYMNWAQKQITVNSQQITEEEKIESEKYKELARAYEKYEELKEKEGIMDFSDLISNTLKIFRTRKNVLKNYQNTFKYILIDEFQDTNFAQNELAVLLAGDKKNITVVGDDNQAIYRWRGAAISNIIQFRQRFPEMKLVVLTTNYRSTSEILDSSYRLIQFNNPDTLEFKEKISKKLTSDRNIKGEKLEFIYTKDGTNEAEKIVERIKEIKTQYTDDKGDEKYSWKDFAILVRANSHAEPFIRALARNGIPYQFLGPGVLFRQSEIKDLIAYLKILYDFTDSVAVYRVLSMPVFAILPRDQIALNSFSRRIGLSLFEAIEIIVAHENNDETHWSKSRNYQNILPFISSETKNTLQKFHKIMTRHLGLVKSETAGQILYYFLEDTGILKSLAVYNSEKEEKVALNISRFFQRLKDFESQSEDASVNTVVDFLDMSLEMGESPLAAGGDWSENDSVNILTVHSSKGLEFGVVFLVNLVNQRFPTTQRKEKIPIPDELVKEILPEGDFHLEEERRLFYVAATRARDRLVLSASKYYSEGKKERKISPFVGEILGKDFKAEDYLAEKKLDDKNFQLTLLEWKKEEEKIVPLVKQPVYYLSYSQIDSFLTCPLQYKYRYLIKIPIPPGAAGSFGSSIHLSLEKFYTKVKKRENPAKQDLLNLLDEVWIPLGYKNKDYEEKMKKRGIEMLSFFYDKLYDPSTTPQSLEQIFKIKLTPNLAIGGKIDRIDTTSDGKMEIIDYKTGKRPTDKEIKENLQMTVYALAATDQGLYGKKPEDVVLSFIFLEAREKLSGTRTKEQLMEAKEKLKEIAKEISESDFEPKKGKMCDFCDFRLVCKAWQE